MKLTVKQEKFCLEYIKDGNASRAYRESYDCSNMKEATIKNNAYKLLQNNDIKTTVEELRQKAEDDGIMSVKELKKFWSDIIRGTIISDEPRLTDKIKASELLGKTAAMFTEKNITELTGALAITKIQREIVDGSED